MCPSLSSNWRSQFLWHLFPSNKMYHLQDHAHPFSRIMFIDQVGQLHHIFFPCMYWHKTGVGFSITRRVINNRSLYSKSHRFYAACKISQVNPLFIRTQENLFQYIESNLEGAGFESITDVDPFLLISDKVISRSMFTTCYYSVQNKYISTKLLKIYHMLSYNFKFKTPLPDFVAFISIRTTRTDQSNSLRLDLRSKSLRIYI